MCFDFGLKPKVRSEMGTEKCKQVTLYGDVIVYVFNSIHVSVTNMGFFVEIPMRLHYAEKCQPSELYKAG